MKSNILKTALLAVSLTASLFAGTTSTTVPVVITNSGACSIENVLANYDLGSAPALMSTAGVALNPISFNVFCSAGMNYNIRSDFGNKTVKANGTGTSYSLSLYGDSQKTKVVSNTTAYTRTGTGQQETVNIYPFIKPPSTGCTTDSASGNKLCDAGTLSTSIQLSFTW